MAWMSEFESTEQIVSWLRFQGVSLPQNQIDAMWEARRWQIEQIAIGERKHNLDYKFTILGSKQPFVKCKRMLFRKDTYERS